MPALLRTLILFVTTGGALMAQIVTPNDQVLVLAPGKSGQVRVVAPCPVEFRGSNGAESMIEFDPGSEKPAKSRSWKITVKDSPGLKGKLAQFLIKLDPAVPDCSPTKNLQFSVAIVNDPKDTTRQFVKGDKKSSPPRLGLRSRLKSLRTDLNKITKAHDFALDIVLDELDQGAVSLPPFLPPTPGDPDGDDGQALGPDTSGLTTSERALVAVGALEFQVLDRAAKVYFQALEEAASEGAAILFNGGYQPYAHLAVPEAFRPGAGRNWDDFVDDAKQLLQSTVRRLDTLSARADQSIEKRSALLGEPLFVQALPLTLPDPGDGGASPMAGPIPNPTRNMGLSMLSVKAWNGPTQGGFDTNNGRLMVLGRVDEQQVILTAQRLNFFGATASPLDGAVLPVDPGTHHVLGLFPPESEPASLQAGTWQLILQANGNDPAFAWPQVPIR